KKTVLSNITHGLRLASERVIEMMPDASAKDALLGVGILTDKMQLLSGEPTAIEDRRLHVDIFSDWDKITEKYLPPENVRELPAETGLPAGNNFLTENSSENRATPIDVAVERDLIADSPQKASAAGTAVLSCADGQTLFGG